MTEMQLIQAALKGSGWDPRGGEHLELLDGGGGAIFVVRKWEGMCHQATLRIKCEQNGYF